LANYRTALAKDPKARRLLEHEITLPTKTKNVTMSLVWSILSQQLSVQVAKVMHERFLGLFGGKFPSAQTILAMPVEEIRAIGISQRKAEYIHHVARFIVEHKVTLKKLEAMQDEEIIELLIQIKGVGRWTVEMLLIFGLGREDVFAVDDLGIQKGMIALFKLEHLDKKELRQRMLKLSQRWSPSRSYICLHMWKFSGFKPK
jgi:DNA-3-methyladenine glycosylase II